MKSSKITRLKLSAALSVLLMSCPSSGPDGQPGSGGGTGTGGGRVAAGGGVPTGSGGGDGSGGVSAGGGSGSVDPRADESAVTIDALSLNLVERSITELQQDLTDKKVSSRQLVLAYQKRIETYNPKLNVVISVNSKALDDATALDAERKAGKIRGPLHGIPIAIKDNIMTEGLATTGGTFAFKDFVPKEDATLVANLKAGGAIILAKTTLTELANWLSSELPIAGGWNALKGQSFNPYDLRLDPRMQYKGLPYAFPNGSSSGGGTAASFWAANVGTETSGSIIAPSLSTMLVGLKPTLGRISRTGIMPITADQDTAGPMARTVRDAAILFGQMESKTPDPKDPATSKCMPALNNDYTTAFNDKDLTGVRIGVPRAFFEKSLDPTGKDLFGLSYTGNLAPDLLNKAVAVLKKRGATIVDNVVFPSMLPTYKTAGYPFRYPCTNEAAGDDANCSKVLLFGMRRDFNAWLKSAESSAPPVKTLKDLIAFNAANKDKAIPYGQDILEASEAQSKQADEVRYKSDRAKDLELAETRGLKAALDKDKLDAIVFPYTGSIEMAAQAGYPNIAVPAGTLTYTNDYFAKYDEPLLPADFELRPEPAGVTFVARPCEESKLFKIAYQFEQGSKEAGLARFPPDLK
jgi:amidase